VAPSTTFATCVNVEVSKQTIDRVAVAAQANVTFNYNSSEVATYMLAYQACVYAPRGYAQMYTCIASTSGCVVLVVQR